MTIDAADATMVEGIRLGNADAAEAFISRFSGTVLLYLAALGVPQLDLDDVQQEVMTAAVHQLLAGLFQARSSLSTWLYAIARAKAYDNRRRARRTRARNEAVRSVNQCAHSHWQAPEIDLLVDQTLRGLTRRDKRIVELVVWEGREACEVASGMGLSTRRVQAIVTDLRRRIADALLGPAAKFRPSSGRRAKAPRNCELRSS